MLKMKQKCNWPNFNKEQLRNLLFSQCCQKEQIKKSINVFIQVSKTNLLHHQLYNWLTKIPANLQTDKSRLNNYLFAYFRAEADQSKFGIKEKQSVTLFSTALYGQINVKEL